MLHEIFILGQKNIIEFFQPLIEEQLVSDVPYERPGGHIIDILIQIISDDLQRSLWKILRPPVFNICVTNSSL